MVGHGAGQVGCRLTAEGLKGGGQLGFMAWAYMPLTGLCFLPKGWCILLKSQSSSAFPWTKEMRTIYSGWRRPWRRERGLLCLLRGASSHHYLFSGRRAASVCLLASLDSMLLSAQRT